MKTKLFIFLFFPLILWSQNFSKQRIELLKKQIHEKDVYAKLGDQKVLLMCDELYTLSKEEGDKKGILIAIIFRAEIYSNRMDTDSCLQSVEEGLPIAEELKSYSDWAALLQYKAKSLMQVKNFDDARSCYSKALKVIDLIDDKNILHFRKYYIYDNLISYSSHFFKEYNKNNYKDSVLYYAQKSYSEILKVSDKFPYRNPTLGQAVQNVGVAYDMQGNYKEAEKYYDYAEKIQIKEDDKRFIANVYLLRGNQKFDLGNNQDALKYWNKSLPILKQYKFSEGLLLIYPKMIEYYRKIGDSKMEAYYLEKNMRLKDSLATINQSALITQNKNDKKALITDKPQKTLFVLPVLIASLVLLSLIIFYFYRRKTKKYPAIEPEKNIKLQDNTADKEQLMQLLEMAKRNDKHLLVIFQNVFPGLYKKLLEFPELTPLDLEMCVYLKLNIQTKDIANYTRASLNSVDSRKYRLRKKMNVPQDTSLYIWINKL
ncbi:tetratricopeptide repeat protein [Chryseobacterium populi]|nr:tetratricopeptide repeat protein [Chryseobacterium populi]